MQGSNKKELSRKSWENKPGKLKSQKPRSAADIIQWKSSMPEELQGVIDETTFCEMCADFDADLQYFPSSLHSQKQTFQDEHFVELIEQLLSDDSKVVARAANTLNNLASGNEAISASIRIRLLADPSTVNNIFHV